MKKKLAALLCVLALVIPALCASEMTDTGYTCDACKYAGSFLMVVTGTETRDGIPGEWISLQCPQCGQTYTTYWRQTGEAEVLAEPEPQAEPAPAEPEAPAAPPQEPSPDQPAAPEEPAAPAEPVVILPPENQQPSGPQAAETVPPVPAAQPDQAPADAPSGQAQPEASGDYGAGTPGGSPAGNPSAVVRRNVQKYPYFSAAYPSRRLNLEGDPDALAPVPGLAVYPEPAAEGSSILQHMLEGND